ncbi:MAG TPA: hypothetical protein VIK95_07190, partial [Egibacteraceae bacterium]
MSMPHDAARSGFGAGTWLSPGAASTGRCASAADTSAATVAITRGASGERRPRPPTPAMVGLVPTRCCGRRERNRKSTRDDDPPSPGSTPARGRGERRSAAAQQEQHRVVAVVGVGEHLVEDVADD